jgi:hypothetical protein
MSDIIEFDFDDTFKRYIKRNLIIKEMERLDLKEIYLKKEGNAYTIRTVDNKYCYKFHKYNNSKNKNKVIEENDRKRKIDQLNIDHKIEHITKKVKIMSI